MKKYILYGIWFCLYVACLFLGYVTEPNQAQQICLLLMALLFFVPGVLLLIDGHRQQDKKTLCILRWISGMSLALTLVLLVANVASALASEAVGNILYELLIFVSVPMVCSQQWLLSMLLWACIFFTTLVGRKRK